MEIVNPKFVSWLGEPFFEFNGSTVAVGQFLMGLTVCVLALVLIGFVRRARRSNRMQAQQAAREAMLEERARESEARMAELIASQNELTGRMQTMSEIFSNRQGDMMRAVNERLENMSGRIGQSITETTKNTQESLAKLQERLAVIDSAQTTITDLTGKVVQLQDILANKQTRGAFGEARMQAIIQDGLPQGAFEFQATLSNQNRPDCLVRMPNESPDLVIDAKFPLEAWNLIRAADDSEAAKAARQQFRRDMEFHIKTIAEKYFVPGETQDIAFMFVPSESIFADIHEKFEGIVQHAHRQRVIIVSPSLLMLSVQVIQSVLKDTRMREQAHLIQAEVIRLMEDVNRMDDRVRKLASHFSQTQKDVDMILTSSQKITKRGNKISDLEFDETPPTHIDPPSQTEGGGIGSDSNRVGFVAAPGIFWQLICDSYPIDFFRPVNMRGRLDCMRLVQVRHIEMDFIGKFFRPVSHWCAAIGAKKSGNSLRRVVDSGFLTGEFPGSIGDTKERGVGRSSVFATAFAMAMEAPFDRRFGFKCRFST